MERPCQRHIKSTPKYPVKRLVLGRVTDFRNHTKTDRHIFVQLSGLLALVKISDSKPCQHGKWTLSNGDEDDRDDKDDDESDLLLVDSRVCINYQIQVLHLLVMSFVDQFFSIYRIMKKKIKQLIIRNGLDVATHQSHNSMKNSYKNDDAVSIRKAVHLLPYHFSHWLQLVVVVLW